METETPELIQISLEDARRRFADILEQVEQLSQHLTMGKKFLLNLDKDNYLHFLEFLAFNRELRETLEQVIKLSNKFNAGIEYEVCEFMDENEIEKARITNYTCKPDITGHFSVKDRVAFWRICSSFKIHLEMHHIINTLINSQEIDDVTHDALYPSKDLRSKMLEFLGEPTNPSLPLEVINQYLTKTIKLRKV